MNNKIYYILGTDAVWEFKNGKAITEDFSLFCYDLEHTHPTEFGVAVNSWGDFEEISEEKYLELLTQMEGCKS